ncbi:hypothetical protein IWX47DRAFT_487735 [Phyllosticta citricarpa]|uniref:Secreted protein n=1 Tax=Phyllosticta citricarpa TaxID=55181 RepID=A0ABR1LGS6_9PEZI
MYTMFCPSRLAALISVYQPLCSAARGKSGSPFPTVLRNEHAMPCHAMSKPVGAAVCVVHWQKQRSTHKQKNPTSQSRAMHPSRMISEETVVMSATYLSCCSCCCCRRRRRRLLMQCCGGASGPPALSHSLDSTPRTPASCVFFLTAAARFLQPLVADSPLASHRVAIVIFRSSLLWQEMSRRLTSIISDEEEREYRGNSLYWSKR